MDSSTTKQNMFRTTLCSSVKYNSSCPHGESCRFAHRIEELNIKPCKRGYRCTFQDCERSHPDESLELFQIRLRKTLENAIKKTRPAEILPVTPDMRTLQKLIEEGRGMGLNENGIAEPIKVMETNIRCPGNTQGLGTSWKTPGKNNHFQGFRSAGITHLSGKVITVSNEEETMIALEMALKLDEMNITLIMA